MCRNIFTKSFRKCAFFVCAPSATRFDTFWDDFTYCWLSVCYISHTMYMRQEYTSPDCAERSRRVYQIISHTLPNHSPRGPKSSGRGSRTVSYIQSCHSVSLVNSSQTIKSPLPHQEATVSQMLKNYVYLYKRYFFDIHTLFCNHFWTTPDTYRSIFHRQSFIRVKRFKGRPYRGHSPKDIIHHDLLSNSTTPLFYNPPVCQLVTCHGVIIPMARRLQDKRRTAKPTNNIDNNNK